MYRPTARCIHLLKNDTCTKIHLKCLERRFWGGHTEGDCPIREVEELRSPTDKAVNTEIKNEIIWHGQPPKNP